MKIILEIPEAEAEVTALKLGYKHELPNPDFKREVEGSKELIPNSQEISGFLAEKVLSDLGKENVASEVQKTQTYVQKVKSEAEAKVVSDFKYTVVTKINSK